MPATPEPVTTYISRLASADAREREDAAHALFRGGCASAEPVLRHWFADRDFRALAASGNALLTVGIAVQPQTFDLIRQRFGNPKLAEVPPDQDVLEFELNFGRGVRLDVIAPRTPGHEGPIAKFLARFGEGIQQVECDVRNVSRAVEILRRRFQLEPIYPEIREGANHTRVNFFLLPLADERKLLIELVETPKPSKQR
jgi:hypothetical protein